MFVCDKINVTCCFVDVKTVVVFFYPLTYLNSASFFFLLFLDSVV